MPIPFHVVAIAAALLLLGGCSRDTLREMGSLKDVAPPASRAQKGISSRGKPARVAKSAEIEAAAEENDGATAIETGSIAKPDACQGAHIAYQATREYLKNFGPRPPDQPGERGPCLPDAQ